MVLPAETEERVKRRALNACQDNLRKVVDVTRKIPQLAEYFVSGDKENARKLLTEIRTGGEEVVKARRMVSQEPKPPTIILGLNFLRLGCLTSFWNSTAFKGSPPPIMLE